MTLLGGSIDLRGDTWLEEVGHRGACIWKVHLSPSLYFLDTMK
jgi:hypothetical protein